MLQRVRDLKVQYDNGTLRHERQDGHRGRGQGARVGDHRASAARPTFNGIKLLDGTGGSAGTITFQVGANGGETISVDARATSPAASGTGAIDGVERSPRRRDAVTLGDIDTAINNISTLRARLRRGAEPPRAPDGEPRRPTRRTWSAPRAGSATWTWPPRWSTSRSSGILQQAGTSMLAQANQAPQSVLSLLR